MTSMEVVLLFALGIICVLLAVIGAISVFAWRMVKSLDREFRGALDLPDKGVSNKK